MAYISKKVKEKELSVIRNFLNTASVDDITLALSVIYDYDKEIDDLETLFHMFYEECLWRLETAEEKNGKK